MLRALLLERRMVESLKIRMSLGSFGFDTVVVRDPAGAGRRASSDGIDLIVADNALLRADPAGWLGTLTRAFGGRPPPAIIYGTAPFQGVDGDILRWMSVLAVLSGVPTAERLQAALDRTDSQVAVS